jgi:hypothetical protein
MGATPQPKSKQTFHHEGREEHEVRKLKCNNFRILRIAMLESLRGWRKLSGIWNIRAQGIDSRQAAKHAKF